MKKILSIVNTAYRAALEEQDDTSLWFNHACRNAGAKIDLLLTGNAVNYTVNTQSPPILSFGQHQISHPSLFHKDIEAFVSGGGQIFYLLDDAKERGISAVSISNSVEGINRAKLASLIEDYDQIWNW